MRQSCRCLGQRQAQRLAEHGVAVGAVADRTLQNHGQRERAGDAVRQAVAQRHLVGNGMRQRGLGVGEGHAGLQRRQCHAAAQLYVAQVAHQARQHVQDIAHGADGEGVGHRVGVDVPDRFQRMRQRIQAALQRDRGRQREHQLGVDHGDTGPGLRQVQRILLLPLTVPDRGPGRDLAAGAGGGGHGDQGLDHMRVECSPGGQQVDQFLETAAGRADHQRLGGVDRAAATDGHDHLHVRVVAPEVFISLGQFGHVRVGQHAVDHAGQLRAEHTLEPRQQTELPGLRKGDQGGLAAPQQFRQRQQGPLPVHALHGVEVVCGHGVPLGRGGHDDVVEGQIEDVEIAQPAPGDEALKLAVEQQRHLLFGQAAVRTQRHGEAAQVVFRRARAQHGEVVGNHHQVADAVGRQLE
eukprot:Opistho-1_new@80849